MRGIRCGAPSAWNESSRSLAEIVKLSLGILILIVRPRWLMIPLPMPDHDANKRRQAQAVTVLARDLPGFYVPTASEKKKLLELLGVSRRFALTFDAIRMRVPS